MGKPTPKSQTPPEKAPRWASNVSTLAAAIGVERQTIYNWQKREGCPTPRANGTYLISEWVEFGKTISTAEALRPQAKADLENRKLKAQAESLEFKLAVEKGEYTPNEVIADEIRRLVHETLTVLRDELDTKMSPAIRAKTRPALDRALARLHKGSEGSIQKLTKGTVAAE